MAARLDHRRMRAKDVAQARVARPAPPWAASPQLHGDHTRLACRRHRRGDELLAQVLSPLKEDRTTESRKRSASRRARHASGARSPSSLHDHGPVVHRLRKITRTVRSILSTVCGLILIAGGLALAPVALAQPRPYIGYVYPAGGQQGTAFLIRLGGQNLDDVNRVLVSGSGVSARVVEYFRRLNNQELQLLNEQLRELRKATSAVASVSAPMTAADATMMMTMQSAASSERSSTNPAPAGVPLDLIARVEKRARDFVQIPACDSIASLVLVEVSIAADAPPGEREIRLATPKGVSNPLTFCVGQVPEFSRKPMPTSTKQILGKEEQALRKRPADEVEASVRIPSTLNGQIASGEVNRYRFAARKGQRLVAVAQARQLVPYIADAVPGWFQPVLVLYDAKGKEMAYADDYRFKPDPVLLYEAPKDGDYVLAIYDAIYRGREDFIYRITLGELPFVTSFFPLGAKAGAPVMPKAKGWNLQDAVLTPLDQEAGPGRQWLVASNKALVANPVLFARDVLADGFDKEPNNSITNAQPVRLPLIINGRMDRPGDWDVFQFSGKSNAVIVAEVHARRLDSPLDAVLKLTDAGGQVLAFNDDREDLGAGLNTHAADAGFMARLPADGTYHVHLGDTARKGGEDYGYRLRLSTPQPDFELRAVPSSLSLRSKATAVVTVYAIRKDGFAGPIKLGLKDPPAGFSAAPVTLSGTQAMTRLTIKTSLVATEEPVDLAIVGSARIGDKDAVREAVPAEDRMQAFLWRHLVAARDLKVVVSDPAYQVPPQRIVPTRPKPAPGSNATLTAEAKVSTNAAPVASGSGTNAAVTAAAAKPKFTKQQIAGRLRQLKLLYEEGLLTDDFYGLKVAECEAAQ